MPLGKYWINFNLIFYKKHIMIRVGSFFDFPIKWEKNLVLCLVYSMLGG